MRERLRALGFDAEKAGNRLAVDTSDTICASYIVDVLRDAPRGTLAVVDYLQLRDRRRDTPPLAEQMRALETFARDRGVILVLLSQIDRAFDPERTAVPDIGHVRLANPLDLSLFSKTCFLNGGEMRFGAV